MNFFTLRAVQNPLKSHPTTPYTQRFWAWHVYSLGCFPFARRYLGNRFYFLFLGVLRCFSSPRWLPNTMYSCWDDTVLTMPGCPIQKSPDQRMFSSSPKLIAAFHVFLLHLTPRHPPFALSSLATIFLPQISLNALMRTYCLKKNGHLLRCFNNILKRSTYRTAYLKYCLAPWICLIFLCQYKQLIWSTSNLLFYI